jgi:hypothetical protein
VALIPVARVVGRRRSGDDPDTIPPIVNYGDGGSWSDLGARWTKSRSWDFDTLIGGHGPVLTKAEFLKYRDRIAAIRERFRALNRERKTQDEITADTDQGIQLGHRARCREYSGHVAGTAVGPLR